VASSFKSIIVTSVKFLDHSPVSYMVLINFVFIAHLFYDKCTITKQAPVTYVTRKL